MTYCSNPHFRGCTIMMTVRRSFLAFRSFSTKRPGRSTKGDAAYESHMQAATVRHRRNRARTKEKKMPDIKTQPKRLSGRRERAPKSAIPTRTPDTQTHRNKRFGTSGGLAKSARNESSGAKRPGMTSRQPTADTSTQGTSSKSASIMESPDTAGSSSSYKFSLSLLLGLTAGSIVWTLGQYDELADRFPLFRKYIDEARQLLPGGDAMAKEAKQDHTSENSNRGWFTSLWRRS